MFGPVTMSSNDSGVPDGDRTAAYPHDRPSRLSLNRPVARLTRHGLLVAAGLLVLAYAGLTAIWSGLGLLVTGPLADTFVGAGDQDLAVWLVQRRTPVGDELSALGSLLAETGVKVIATAVIAVVVFVVWRSWRDPFLICFSLILEASVFITVTAVVGRPRPGVPAMDEVSVATSFPSGHAAAAAAYCAIAIVIFEHTRNLWIRGTTVTLAIAIPLIVGMARMYRGVHHLTDVITGIALGVACAVIVELIIRRSFERGTGSPTALRPDQRPP